MSTEIVMWQQGFVRGFKLNSYNESLFANILGMYEGEQIEFCIRKKKKKVTSATHGYYRGILLPFCLSSNLFGGWRIDEIHDYFADKFLGDIKTKEFEGKNVIIRTVQSTGELDQKQMNQFINDVRQFMSEHDISTPEPLKQIPHVEKNS